MSGLFTSIKMETYTEIKALERELAGLKKTYRNSELDKETARYIATEIKTIEGLLR